MKGEERAKELWTVRISSEFERASPRSYQMTLVSTVESLGLWWIMSYI